MSGLQPGRTHLRPVNLRHLPTQIAIPSSITLEICIDSVESGIAAQRGGAQRVELCSSLIEGGITPSSGLIQSVRSSLDLDLYVIIRPRGGDFCYTDLEFECMIRDIVHARDLGANGVALGILDAAGRIDVTRTRQLVERAHPLPVTFHRAFDVSADLSADLSDSLERIIDTGAQRLLTSGGAATAVDGLAQIARLRHQCRGRIALIAAGKVSSTNVAMIRASTGVDEFHAALRTRVPSPARHRPDAPALGLHPEDSLPRFVVLEKDVRALRAALDRL